MDAKTEATIRLFKAVAVDGKTTENRKLSAGIAKETIRRGFVFSPKVIGAYRDKELTALISVIEKEIGLTPEMANASFHKSWAKVRDAPIEQLFIEQIMHYITTYGFESLGVYDEGSVYIPYEKLEIPGLNANIRLVVINGYTKDELKVKLLDLLGSGIALKDETINDVVAIADYVKITKKNLADIKNKEVRCRLYAKMKIVPENPIEFLRLMVFKTTEKTLLIKNKDSFTTIRESSGADVAEMLANYETEYGLANLSSIFYRYKPLFLALKNSATKGYINNLRRLAKDNHSPMVPDYLNTVTAQIKNDEFKLSELKVELAKVSNPFRKIRLAYALKYRTHDMESILYRVRNGKGYATEFKFENTPKLNSAFKAVVESIAEDIAPNVKGKRIYIPDYVSYALPSSEKMFSGDLPSGTCITVPDDILVGVHWDNLPGDGYASRIDLDLSMLGVSAGKMGWDARWRNDEGVLFSGDMTDAPLPHGASELFYVPKPKKATLDTFLLMVNYFNFNESKPVPYKTLVANEKRKDLPKNFMVNPNSVLSVAKSKIEKQQKILGFLDSTIDGNKFYYAETYMGKSITSGDKKYHTQSRDYLLNFYRNSISLNDIIKMAGGKIITKRNKDTKIDIDLSPEALQKDTIVSLFKAKKEGKT